jgi:hypothetical protein
MTYRYGEEADADESGETPKCEVSMAVEKQSVADELLKLAELKGKGILTEEEFSVAKAALLRTLESAAPPDQAQTREQLEQLKNSVAKIAPEPGGERDVLSILKGAEDLLTAICGRDRYQSLISAASELVEMASDWMEAKRSGDYKERRRLGELLTDSFDQLKKRISGIDFRK